ncbi:hypothetical protein VN0142_10460 [Helicobacter pylori]
MWKTNKNLGVTNKIQFEKYLSHAETELKNDKCFKKITYLDRLTYQVRLTPISVALYP